MKSNQLESFENLVDALLELPTIGKKSAIRLAYNIVTEDSFKALKLSYAIEEAVNCIGRCERCSNLSESTLCGICMDDSRDKSKLCMVQSAKDILLLEQSGEYDGLYYVIESIESLNREHLVGIAGGVNEVIFAFVPSIAAETMMLYIEQILEGLPIVFTKIAQGVPMGVDLENVDLLSLTKALQSRTKI